MEEIDMTKYEGIIARIASEQSLLKMQILKLMREFEGLNEEFELTKKELHTDVFEKISVEDKRKIIAKFEELINNTADSIISDEDEEEFESLVVKHFS